LIYLAHLETSAAAAREITTVPATYLEAIEKLQQQGLDTLKQAQAAQIAALTSIREIVATLPAAPAIPSLDKLPSFSELTELSQTFVKQLAAQQSAYVAELAGFFSTVQKDAAAALDKAAQSATTPK
jgi:hypothetical protein